MSHNIVMTGESRFCSLCGEDSAAGFSKVCQAAFEHEKLKLEAAAEQEKLKLKAAAEQEKLKLEAASARETRWQALWLIISLITLSVVVFFFHGAVAWGDQTTDKWVTSLNAGFGKGRDGLGAVAVAVGAGNLAQMGPHAYVAAGLRRLFSALGGLSRGLGRGV